MLVNAMLVALFDYLFGVFMPEVPTYYQSQGYYSSNYRDYFIPGKLANGTTVFHIPSSPARPRNYESSVRTDGYYHIFAFGDSFTEGQGVDANDAWPRQLEDILGEKKVRVSNYGDSGTSIVEIAKKIKMKVHNKNKPNLLVYGLVLNDPVYLPIKNAIFLDRDKKNDYGEDTGLYHDLILWRTKVFENNRSPFLNFIFRNSQIGRFFISRYELSVVTAKTKDYYQSIFDSKINPKGLKKTFELLEQIDQHVKKNDGKLLVMIFPLFYQLQRNYPFLSIHQFLAAELSKRGIEVLDLYPTYRRFSDSDLWVHPSDLHPNDFAHRLAAKALKEWFEKNVEMINGQS